MARASYPAIPSPFRARLAFVALAVGTIAVGLIVHWRGTLLPATLRDVLGDALWAVMICWWIGAVVPNTGVASRAGLALAICWIVEVSQLYHTPLLDAWRRLPRCIGRSLGTSGKLAAGNRMASESLNLTNGLWIAASASPFP